MGWLTSDPHEKVPSMACYGDVSNFLLNVMVHYQSHGNSDVKGTDFGASVLGKLEIISNSEIQ